MKAAENKIKKSFAEYFLEKSEANRCPFLSNWVNSKFAEISKLPGKPQRKGIPKGQKIPPPRVKVVFALYELILPNFSLKKFADDVPSASYGTIRIWKNSESVYEILFDLCSEYITAYANHLRELIEADEINNVKISQHLGETVFYKNNFLIGQTMHEISDTLHNADLKDSDYCTFNKLAASQYFQFTMIEKMDDMKEHRVFFKDTLNINTMFYSRILETLVKVVESGDTKNAIRVAKLVKNVVLENVVNERNRYALEAYDLKPEKKRRFFGN